MIKINNKLIELHHFPDNTLNIKLKPIVNSSIVISWFYENDAEYMALAFITKYYQAKNNDVVLFLPYIPNARMDRVEYDTDVFTLKYFCQLINSLNFTGVYVCEPHSNVSAALINKCAFINFDDVVNKVINNISEESNEEVCLFYPDEGAMKRYSKKVDRPFAFGIKKRDWQTGKILGLEVMGMTPDDIKGKSFLIRDDICSKGGTFYFSAKKLKELGANKIYLFIGHCENSIFDGEFGEEKSNLLETGLIERVYTTNSIYTKYHHMINTYVIELINDEIIIR